MRGYPDNLVNKVLSEVKFEERKSALLQGIRAHNNSVTIPNLSCVLIPPQAIKLLYYSDIGVVICLCLFVPLLGNLNYFHMHIENHA